MREGANRAQPGRAQNPRLGQRGRTRRRSVRMLVGAGAREGDGPTPRRPAAAEKRGGRAR